MVLREPIARIASTVSQLRYTQAVVQCIAHRCAIEYGREVENRESGHKFPSDQMLYLCRMLKHISEMANGDYPVPVISQGLSTTFNLRYIARRERHSGLDGYI